MMASYHLFGYVVVALVGSWGWRAGGLWELAGVGRRYQTRGLHTRIMRTCLWEFSLRI
jgi:hypothetical protein